jgi:hypothetical protein
MSCIHFFGPRSRKSWLLISLATLLLAVQAAAQGQDPSAAYNTLAHKKMPSQAVFGSTPDRLAAYNNFTPDQRHAINVRIQSYFQSKFQQAMAQRQSNINSQDLMVHSPGLEGILQHIASSELNLDSMIGFDNGSGSSSMMPLYPASAGALAPNPPAGQITGDDLDHDGLPDNFENQLSDLFKPSYHVSRGEPDNFATFANSVPMTVQQRLGPNPFSYFRVKPLGFTSTTASPGHPSVEFGIVQIDYLTLWDHDSGLDVSALCDGLIAVCADVLGVDLINLVGLLSGHDLDDEHAAALVVAPTLSPGQYNFDPTQYSAINYYTAAHEGTITDHSAFIDPGFAVPAGAHIKLWLSRNKHSTYDFNPDGFPIIPFELIFAYYATISDLFDAQVIGPDEYLYLLYVGDTVFFACVIEHMSDQGGVYASQSVNVGEPPPGNVLNNAGFILDPNHVLPKLTTPLWTLVPPNYQGYVDHMGCDTIAGWAANRNRLNAPVNVAIYDGQTRLQILHATDSRPDVGNYLGDNGLHGFNILTPLSLKDGVAHQVSVRFEGSDINLTSSPKSLTCAPSIVISPSNTTIEPRQTVTLSSNLNTSWSLLGPGTLSTAGPSTSVTYTPPISANIGTVAVTATDPNNTSNSASATIRLTAPALALGGVTPSSGSSTAATFTFSATDGAVAGIGNNAPVAIGLQFNPAGQGVLNSNVCQIMFGPGQTGAGISNLVFLQNDDGSFSSNNWGPPGAAQTLSNSQCSVNLAGTFGSINGNTITLTVPVTFTAGFAGQKTIYENIWDASFSVGYQAVGSWTVPQISDTLTVTKSSSGTGRIGSSAGGIFCGNACSATFTPGTTVTVTATPDAGSTFAGWSGGGCSGTNACTLTINSATSVTATFVNSAQTTGGLISHWSFDEGGGTIAYDSSSYGANGTIFGAVWTGGRLGSALQFNGVSDYVGVNINLPVTEYTFAAWFKTTAANGALMSVVDPVSPSAPAHDRHLGLQGGRVCHRVWSEETYCSPGAYNDGLWHLAAVTVGNGGGHLYVDGVLVATGNKTASDFNWQSGLVIGNHGSYGAFAGAIDDVRIYNRVLSAAEIASLYAPPTNLAVSVSGSGTVISTPGGLNCSSSCSASFNNGASVTLTASPGSGYAFAGWSGGGCSGTGSCTIQLNQNTSVGASFVPSLQTLMVGKSGSGTGTVSSSPGGIWCGGTCSANFTGGSYITLTATPDAGSAFAGWSGGGCFGTGACTVLMNSTQSVTAIFNAASPVITAVTDSSYSSTLYSYSTIIVWGSNFSPGGGNTLQFHSYSGFADVWMYQGDGHYYWDYATNQINASVDYRLASGWWSVTVRNASGTPSAAFNVYINSAMQTLYVSKNGSGTGTVSSSPSNIWCGYSCTAGFASGTYVTLYATADPGSTFAGWSGGGCFGTGPCTLWMGMTQWVTATFNMGGGTPTITAVTDGGYNSTLYTWSTIVVWGTNFSPGGGNTLQFQSYAGLPDVWAYQGDGHYYWDFATNQINASLDYRLAQGWWMVTVRNASGAPSSAFWIYIN